MSPPPNQPRIIVGSPARAASTREKLLGLLLLLAVAVVSGVLTRALILARNGDARNQVIELVAQLESAREQLQVLDQQLAIAQRGDQVTQGANDELRNEIVRLQEESADLRADIEFYQRLLGSGGTSNGLAVHGLQLARTVSPRVYRYELTLSQNLEKAQIVSGSVKLLIEGVENDQPRTLDALQLNPANGEAELGFEFKYFQLLRGSFALPEGYVAERVRVQLVPGQGRGGKPLSREFDWVELVQEEQVVQQVSSGDSG